MNSYVLRKLSNDFVIIALLFVWVLSVSPNSLLAQTAIQMTPEYQQAQQLLAQSNFDAAVAALQPLLEKPETSAAAQVEVGSIRMRQAENEMSQALSHFAAAAAHLASGIDHGGVKGPDKPRVMYDLGRIYEERLNDYAKAAEIYKRIVDYYPNFMSVDKAAYHLGLTYERLGKRAEAAKVYGDIVTKYPYSSFFEEAKNRMKSVVIGAGKGAAEAIEVQEKLAEEAGTDSQSAQANLDLGAMYAGQGDYAKAVEAYKKAAEDAASPELAKEAYKKMASLLDEKQKDYKGAAAALEEMVEKYPDIQGVDETLFKLGRIYEENLTDYKTRIIDGNVRYRKNDENIRKAIEYYDQLTEKYPDAESAAEAYLHKGNLYRSELKDFDEARKQYSEFLKRYPDHPEAETVRQKLKELEDDR